MKRHYVVDPAYDGWRLTDMLSAQAHLSTRHKKHVRLHGEATRNGQWIRFVDRVHANDVIVLDDKINDIITPPHDETVVYEDTSYLVINKPAGVLSHPAYHDDRMSVVERTGARHIIGRLDCDTSGLVLIAKDAVAHHQTVAHPIQKWYLALCHGRPAATRLVIDKPLKRSGHETLRRIVHPDGQRAVTVVVTLASTANGALSLLACRLVTGRTHQIRAHLLHHGCPLVGDWLYGLGALEAVYPGCGLVDPARAAYAERLYTNEAWRRDLGLGRHALHARSLSFVHVDQMRRVTVHAPWPRDLSQYVLRFGDTALHDLQHRLAARDRLLSQ